MFWLGAIVSLCYIPGVTGAYIATQWPVLAVLLSFGLLRSGTVNVLHLVGLIFVAYAAALVPFSPVPYASVFGLWLVAITGLCLWFGTTLTNTRGLYAGLAFGASVSSAAAVLQYFGVSIVPTTSAPLPSGIYVNSVQQGTVLTLVAVALITERMWIWLLPIAPGILLAQSRGAWLALAVGLLGCGVRRVWVLGAVAVAGVAYLVLPSGSSDTERLFIWRAAWDNLTWFGWGPGVFYTILLTDGPKQFMPEYVHNDALQLLFEYGTGALLPFVIFGYALCRTDAKEWPVVLVFVTAGCYSMPLFMPVAAFLAFVAVGRILRVDDVACGDGGSRRQHFLPADWRRPGMGAAVVSVAPYHTAKG